MVTTRGSSDQRKWQEAFHKLLQLLKNQQTQIESFVNERKILEDRMNLQHNRWQSDMNLLMDQLSQEKKKSAIQEMSRHVDSTKAELLQMMKQKEAFIYKTKLDRTLDDLSDFRAMYSNYLTSQQSSNGNMINPPEVLALLSERDFAWNQFKKMESRYVTQLKNKSSEIEDANAKIKKLESMNADKDELILKLQTDLSKFDSVKRKKKGEEDVSTSRPRTSSAAAASRRKNNKLESMNAYKDDLILKLQTDLSKFDSVKRKKKGEEDVSTSRPRTRSAAAAASRRKNYEDYSKVSQISNTRGRSLKRSRKSMENSGNSGLFKSTFKIPKLKLLSHDAICL